MKVLSAGQRIAALQDKGAVELEPRMGSTLSRLRLVSYYRRRSNRKIRKILKLAESIQSTEGEHRYLSHINENVDQDVETRSDHSVAQDFPSQADGRIRSDIEDIVSVEKIQSSEGEYRHTSQAGHGNDIGIEVIDLVEYFHSSGEGYQHSPYIIKEQADQEDGTGPDHSVLQLAQSQTNRRDLTDVEAIDLFESIVSRGGEYRPSSLSDKEAADQENKTGSDLSVPQHIPSQAGYSNEIPLSANDIQYPEGESQHRSDPWSRLTEHALFTRKRRRPPDTWTCEERKEFMIHRPTKYLKANIVYKLAKEYATIPEEIRADEENCWIHPHPPACRKNGRQAGSIQINLSWYEQEPHKLSVNMGLLALLHEEKVTAVQKEGYIREGWHLSHLCGNWTCVNKRHMTVEPANVNISRNACFRRRCFGCRHVPACMKEKKMNPLPRRESEVEVEVVNTDSLQPWNDPGLWV
ncbi:MAG: hypothetical protein M1816_003886 [Peltula sp. TS41687]|nr:MAG: hypothetical protein M1816_003886 [Peltula sp. TS41687]